MAVAGTRQRIVAAVHGWEKVEIRPHRYGGLELRLGKRELGHVHGDALVDIPFPRRYAMKSSPLERPNRIISCRSRGGSASSCEQTRTCRERSPYWSVPSTWR